jgi:hypothetical protein
MPRRRDPGTRRQLQEAAIQNECSISEEIERRIQQSFELNELLGTERPSLPAQLVSRAIEEVEGRYQKRWFETEQMAAVCREAGIKVIDVVLGAPLENQLWPDEVKTAFQQAAKNSEEQGSNAARAVLYQSQIDLNRVKPETRYLITGQHGGEFRSVWKRY